MSFLNDLWQSMNYDIQHVYLEQYILSNRYNCRPFISRQYFPCHKLYSPYPFSCYAFFYKNILNISECVCNKSVESKLLWLAFFNKWIRNCKYVILPYKHIKHRTTHLLFLKMLGCKFAHIQIVFSHFSCCECY